MFCKICENCRELQILNTNIENCQTYGCVSLAGLKPAPAGTMKHVLVSHPCFIPVFHTFVSYLGFIPVFHTCFIPWFHTFAAQLLRTASCSDQARVAPCWCITVKYCDAPPHTPHATMLPRTTPSTPSPTATVDSNVHARVVQYCYVVWRLALHARRCTGTTPSVLSHTAAVDSHVQGNVLDRRPRQGFRWCWFHTCFIRVSYPPVLILVPVRRGVGACVWGREGAERRKRGRKPRRKPT